MIEIRNVAENGLVYMHENEDLLLGSEIVDRGSPGITPLMDQRAEAFAEAINGLARFITAVEDGSYRITYITNLPYSDLAAHISDLNARLGLPDYELLPWIREGGGESAAYAGNAGYLSYIRLSPGSTTALPPSAIPWWASILPEACSTEQAGPEEEAVRTHNTPFWVHIPDIINHPERADWIDRDFPRSGTTLAGPPTGTTAIAGQGDSFPLMREGNLYYYYSANGQRINLPGLQQQFPQLAE